MTISVDIPYRFDWKVLENLLETIGLTLEANDKEQPTFFWVNVPDRSWATFATLVTAWLWRA